MQSIFCPTDELQSHGVCCRTEFIRSPLPGWFTGETRSSAGKNTHPSKKKVTTRNRLDVTSGSVRPRIRGIYSTSDPLQSIYTKHKNEAFISWQKFLILQALTWACFLHKISRKKFGLLADFLSIVKFVSPQWFCNFCSQSTLAYLKTYIFIPYFHCQQKLNLCR